MNERPVDRGDLVLAASIILCACLIIAGWLTLWALPAVAGGLWLYFHRDNQMQRRYDRRARG